MNKNIENELLREIRNVRKDLKFLKTRLDEMEISNWRLIAELIPEVKPTKEERKILEEKIKKKDLASEKELFKALE
jgi:hypothetical protein